MDFESSNKRPREENDQGFDGHGRPQFQDFEAKRQRIDPAQELINNVCKDIRRLGENPNLGAQIDDVNYISNPIVAEFEKIDALRNAILTTIHSIIIEQPHKINAICNLVFICNAKNFVIAKYVIEYLHAKIQLYLDSVSGVVSLAQEKREDAGAFNSIKSILKFLSALSPIIDDYAIINVFTQFLQYAIDLQTQSGDKRHGIAQEIYYNTLISVPYLLSNDKSEEIRGHMNDLIELAEKFPIVEPESHKMLQPFDTKMENLEIPYEPKKLIDLILPSLKVLQENDWQLTLFLDFEPFLQPILQTALENNSISKDVIKHKLPQFSLPAFEKVQVYKPSTEESIDKVWQQNSRLLFQVYNQNTEFETVPPIESYVGLFFKDMSFDILTNLSFNKNEAAIQLAVLDLFFSADLFTPVGTSIEQLNMINDDNKSGENDPPLSTWKMEDVAVESILTMIFQLPRTLHREIYYYTVLIACCKESPESMAPVFGRAIRYFYANLQTLDYELKIRFLDWMTTQISNFEFSWKWEEWVEDSQQLSELKYHPKKNFIKNLIAKEIRLSNKKRIRESFIDVVDGEVVNYEEFYQYLNIALFSDVSNYIINYDAALYGDSPEIKAKLTDLYNAKQASLQAKSNVSFQDEIFYNFTNPALPYHELGTRVYQFVMSHHKSNKEFNDLYNSIIEDVSKPQMVVDQEMRDADDATAETQAGAEAGAEAETEADDNANANEPHSVEVSISEPVKFAINLIIQTYCYIGSRSIYSEVSILSRDVEKLKFLSGQKLETKEKQSSSSAGEGEANFEDLQLEEETIKDRQNWIIDAVFRIWVHQPQVVFLILENMIEFGIIKSEYLLVKAFKANLIIDNVSCMESVNRILENSKPEELKYSINVLFREIVSKLNKLDLGVNDVVKIDELEGTNATEVDKQWLFYEYLGLLKSYFRKFIKSSQDVDEGGEELQEFVEKIKTVFNDLQNIPTRINILSWFNELIN
ncbi:uncharacterized protein LODBEIA_P04580 [Lodderomyces beijingensis]|uniref:MIF4G domain-containing protein n=1 Tax=Lodderomyces beijingensis TaxID=1775926 RepID=A0ABP0ZDH7_9ASCO